VVAGVHWVASGGIWANLRFNTISWDQGKSGCDRHADANFSF
jgi:hypothetical protein